MPLRHFRSVRKRLAIAVSAGSMLCALIVGLAAFELEYKKTLARSAAVQDQLVTTVQASATVAAFASNEAIAQEVIQGLLASPLIAGVHLESLNGFEQGGEKTAQQGEAHPDVKVKDYPLYSPLAPQERIGHLYVWRNQREIHARAISAALDYALVLALQIGVTAVLMMLVSERILGNPLNRVARALEAVPPGSHQRIAPIPGHENDEIGMLVASSNTLLDAVERAIAEERKLQAEVDEMQAHYKRIFETSNVGIMILHPSGQLLNSNPTLMSRIVGVRFDTHSAKECQDFLEAIFCQPQDAWKMVEEARDSGQSVAADLQLKNTEGKPRWAHCLISVSRGPDGRIDLIEGVLYDVTKRMEREAATREAAAQDALTGLANRRGLEQFLSQACERAARDQHAFGVMGIDLDGFKAVNDTYGHGAGDEVLHIVAERLSRLARQGKDLVARPGGDEFVVVIYDIERAPELLASIAGNIIRKLSQPIRLHDGTLVHIGASLGIARYPEHAHSPETLLAAADEAMYQVKRQGKNAYAFHTPTAPRPNPD